MSLEDNEPEDIVSTDMDLDEEWVLSDSEEEQDEYACIGVNKSYNDQIDAEMLKPIMRKPILHYAQLIVQYWNLNDPVTFH